MEQKLKRYELDSDYIQGICDMEENQNGEFVKFSDIEPLIEVLKFYAAKCPKDSGMAPQFLEVHDGKLSENFGLNARQALKKVGIE